MNDEKRSDATAVVLAGGESIRMGTDKAFLELGGVPLIERVLAAARAACGHVLIIANNPDEFAHLGVAIHTDIHPGFGSMSGLHAGLFFAETETVFTLGCDMPFIEPRLMEYIISVRGDADAAVPMLGEFYEPLFCAYARTSIDEVEKAIRESRRQVVSLFFDRLKLRTVTEDELRAVDPELESLVNINTPDDLERAERIAKQRTKEHT